MQHVAIILASLLLVILPLPHTIAIRLASLFLLVVIVIYYWKSYAPPSLPCKRVGLLWVLFPIILLPFALAWRYSLGEIKSEIGYGVIGFLVFFAISQHISKLKSLLAVLGGSAVLYSIIGMIQAIPVGLWDELSIVGGSASFATYVITIVPLVLPMWWLFPSKRNYLLAGLTVVVLGGLCTNQRIVFPVLVIQLLLASALLKPTTISFKKLIIILSAVLVVLSVITFISLHLRDTTIGIPALDEDPRALAWQRTLTILMEQPLTGFGFGRNAMKLAHPEISDIMWHAHNTLLNYGIALGVFGIVVLSMVWGCLGWQYWRIQKAIGDPLLKASAVAGLCVVLGVILRNQVNDMFHRDLSLLFWCVNGMLLGFLLRQSQGKYE